MPTVSITNEAGFVAGNFAKVDDLLTTLQNYRDAINALEATNYSALSVTEPKIANNAVITRTILDSNFTTAKLANGVLSADAAGLLKMADGFLSADACW